MKEVRNQMKQMKNSKADYMKLKEAADMVLVYKCGHEKSNNL